MEHAASRPHTGRNFVLELAVIVFIAIPSFLMGEVER
jgi:hypothetical protein